MTFWEWLEENAFLALLALLIIVGVLKDAVIEIIRSAAK